MEYRKLGNSELKVFPIGMGTWALGNDTFGEVVDKDSIRALQAGIDAGINLIDTAPAYGAGHAEEVVGRAIKGRRDRVTVATKCGVYREGESYIRSLKPARIRKDIEESLQRLDLEYIDIYQIHWPDPDTLLEDSVKELIKLRKEGKFRYLGVSNFGVDRLEKILKMTNVISLQPHYSLLKRDIEADVLPYIIKKGLGVISYGTLGGGILSGKYNHIPDNDDEKDKRDEFYPFYKEDTWSKTMELIDLMKRIADKYNKPVVQIAINWTINQPGITTTLVGVKTEKQAIQNAAAGKWKLAKDDLEVLNKKSKEIEELINSN